MCSWSLRPGSQHFAAIAARERCPFAVIGEIDDTRTAAWCTIRCSATSGGHADRGAAGQAAAHASARRTASRGRAGLSTQRALDLREAAYRVLRLPAVADKTFLITIGDRTVGGLVSRDQLVGPWQVPVSDVGGHADRLCRSRRRGNGHGRANAGGRARRAGVRSAGGGRGHHQHAGRRRRRRSRRSGCRRTGWRPAASPARTPRCMRRCAQWARSCVRRSASRFRWARTRCR